jgi:hypothetical protein
MEKLTEEQFGECKSISFVVPSPLSGRMRKEKSGSHRQRT